MRSRPLRAAATLLLLPVATAAGVVGVANLASAAVVNQPPIIGHQIISFPQRDFVSATGYLPDSTVTVEVWRKVGGVDTLISQSAPWTPQDDPRTPAFDGLVEVNHPGGTCWNTVTPDIRPGDEIRLHEVNPSFTDTPDNTHTDITTTQNVVVTQPAFSPRAGVIEVHGTAATAAGAPIDITTLDQRLVANRDAFDANGRRTLRAASVPDDGTLTYDAPGSTHWTATYSGLSAADVARAIGAESRINWLGAVPLNANESTIYEYGAVGGPTAPCTAPLNAPVATITPSDVLFPATDTGTDSAATALSIANTGAGANADLTVASVTSDSADFVVGGTPCATAIPTGGSCSTQTVTFHPTADGLRTGTLTVHSDASNGDQKITVAGVGANAASPAAVFVARPATLTFATRLPGTTSPSQRVTFTNIGNAPASPDAVTASAASYAVKAQTCYTGAIAPGFACTADVTFTPATTGALPANLVLATGGTTNATVALKGSGLVTDAVNDPPVLPVSILDFSVRDFISSSGFQADDLVTVEVIRHGVVVGFSSDNVPQDDPLTAQFDGIVEINHPGGSCWADPYTPDLRPGDIVRTVIQNATDPVRDGRADQTHVVDVGIAGHPTNEGGVLTAHGWARGMDGKPIPVGELSQRFVANKQAFQVNGRRTLRAGFGGGEGTITYDPIGPGNPDGSNWTVKYPGLSAADVNRALTTSEARIIWLGRDPIALFEGTFFELDAPPGPAAGFCSTPAEPPSPDYEYAPGSITFPSWLLGSTTPTPKVATLRNTGNADLHVSGISLTGTHAAEFALDGATTCTTSTVLTPGGTCAFAVTFSPTGAVGPRSAKIVVTDDVVGPPQEIAITGLAVDSAVGFATVAPAELAFPDQHIPSTSAPLQVVVTNEGQAPLTIPAGAVTFAGTNGNPATHDFLVPSGATDDTCSGATIAPNATCRVNVVFSASALNARTDTLKIATTPAISVPLSGNAVGFGLINDPPSNGHSILVFTERDFISASGYAPTDNVTVQVVRNGTVIGHVENVVPQDDPKTAGFDGLVDVNHPGGVCWTTLTPDIRPGDVVRVFPNGIADGTAPEANAGDQTHAQGVTVTQSATETPVGSGTIVVKGTAKDVFTGGRIPIGQVEVRIIGQNLFEANGKRALRAGPALDGTIAYDTPTSTSFTATFPGLSAADVRNTIENIDPTGKNIGGETRTLWLGRDPLALNELTFFEHGAVGGPVAGFCTAPLGAASLTATPNPVVFTAVQPNPVTPQDIPVTITNVGNAKALLQAPVILPGADAANFSIVSSTCPVDPATLDDPPAANTCIITVRFNPSTVGNKTATLQLDSDAAGAPLQVPLSGAAVGTPTLTAIQPQPRAAIGAAVTLKGTGFTGATRVTFGAVNIAVGGFTVVNDTTITTVVPAGLVGPAPVQVSVSNVAGASNTVDFNVVSAPTITGFTPNTGSGNLIDAATGLAAPTQVTISGTDLDGGPGAATPTRVLFNGVAGAVVGPVAPGTITATVPATATSGRITVVTAVGQVISAGTFTVVPSPTVTSLTNTASRPGDTVTITGTNITTAAANGVSPSVVLYQRTGAADLPATVQARTATSIRFTVPATGSGPYRLVVRTPVTIGGTAYYVQSAPTNVSVNTTPTITAACAFLTQAAATAGTCSLPVTTNVVGAAGTWIRLQGSGFFGTTSVSFGGQKATVFSLPEADITQRGGVIIVQVPAGSKSGAIQVGAAGGSGSANGFTFLGAPTVTAVTPVSVPAGQVVTLTGTGFVASPLAPVSLVISAGPGAGIPMVVTVVSATQLRFTVPVDQAKGTYNVLVTTLAGTVQAPQRITVT